MGALAGSRVFEASVDSFYAFSLIELVTWGATSALVVDWLNTPLRSESEGFSALDAGFVDHMQAAVLLASSLTQS